MPPKVSIITINLNHADGLARTFQSIKAHKQFDYEYLVIDGGSTDGSVEVIKGFSEKIDYWISEPDKGVYNAMNKGIHAAKGEYCYFLNSGDTLAEPQSLCNLLDGSDNEDIIYGNMIHGGPESLEKGPSTISFQHFFNGSIYHQSALIKRELLTTEGLYNESLKIVSDWEFFVKAIFFKNCTTRYVDTSVARYETGGLSFQSPERNRMERMQVLNTCFPRFIDDYEKLNSFTHSDLAGVHRKLESSAALKKTLSAVLRVTRYLRFRVLKMKY